VHFAGLLSIELAGQLRYALVPVAASFSELLDKPR
jgi:hypothetical protein